MKKLLLSALALGASVAAIAMEPLTPDQLEKFRINVSNYVDGTFGLSSAVSLEYADNSNPNLLQIQNFIGDGLPLKLNVDWETGTLSAIPYTFSQDYDDGSYLMVVSEEASNLSSPRDEGFGNSKVTGTISESGITLNAWNLVKVDRDFSSLTKVYSQSLTTDIHLPNATMTLQMRGVNWDKEDPDTYVCPIEDTEKLTFRTYVKDNGTDLLVYNWDDMASCVKLYKSVTDGKIHYSTKADEIIYVRNAKYQYGIYPFAGKEDTDLYEVEAAPLVSEAVTKADQVDFGYWLIYALNRKQDRSMGSYAKLKLDFNLDLNTSGIADSVTNQTSVKVTYYNLQGVEVANPTGGVYIKVDTCADGSTRVSKIAL